MQVNVVHHVGRCFCGEVQFTVSGAPAAMGYCHCESCRHWSGGPVNAFTLWPPDAIRMLHGADRLGTFSKTPTSLRHWCTKCGGHVFSHHPAIGLTDIYAAVIPSLKFEPSVHINYQESRLRIHDGLPKLKDFPKEMGGSGDVLAE